MAELGCSPQELYKFNTYEEVFLDTTADALSENPLPSSFYPEISRTRKIIGQLKVSEAQTLLISGKRFVCDFHEVEYSREVPGIPETVYLGMVCVEDFEVMLEAALAEEPIKKNGAG